MPLLRLAWPACCEPPFCPSRPHNKKYYVPCPIRFEGRDPAAGTTLWPRRRDSVFRYFGLAVRAWPDGLIRGGCGLPTGAVGSLRVGCPSLMAASCVGPTDVLKLPLGTSGITFPPFAPSALTNLAAGQETLRAPAQNFQYLAECNPTWGPCGEPRGVGPLFELHIRAGGSDQVGIEFMSGSGNRWHPFLDRPRSGTPI